MVLRLGSGLHWVLALLLALGQTFAFLRPGLLLTEVHSAPSESRLATLRPCSAPLHTEAWSLSASLRQISAPHSGSPVPLLRPCSILRVWPGLLLAEVWLGSSLIPSSGPHSDLIMPRLSDLTITGVSINMELKTITFTYFLKLLY